MLKNYFKIALRNLRKQKLYSLINIAGLSIGIAGCIIIFLFIQDELSFDRFHENADSIYRVEELRYEKLKSDIEPTPFYDTSLPDGVSKSPWLPLPLGPTIAESFPEIKHFSRVEESTFLARHENRSFQQDVLMADSAFFKIFSFPLLEGTADDALNDPGKVVITLNTARKYFKEDNPVGKTLIVTIQGEEKLFTVSAIAKEPPENSSITFSMVMRIENEPYYDFNIERWNSFNTPLFVNLYPGASPDQFVDKLRDFAEERYSESRKAARDRLGMPEDAAVAEFDITPLTGIHLDASAYWHKVSNPLYSYILGTIAVLILIIACINYITLALARSSGRAKEVGIRKASGARRMQIAIQFWGETQLLSLLAMLAGVCMAELALPLFNNIAGKTLSISYTGDAGFLTVLFGITLLSGILAGSYPALILSGFQPVKVLKGLKAYAFKPRLSKALLVVQYSLSIFLIISSLVMFRQMEYVSGKELGYDEEQVVFIPTHTGWNEKGTRLMEHYRTVLSEVPSVKYVSGMAPALTRGSNIYAFGVNGEEKRSHIYYVDEDLINTLGIELVAGRDFSEDRPSDVTGSIIVNESFVESMRWEDPIGRQVPWKGEENPSTVIGVVKDFHFQSMESKIEPMLFHMDPAQGGISSVAVKIAQGSIAETLPKLEEAWSEVAPFTPFNYWFLDDALSQQYEDYRRWLNIMAASTALAILISCLGLFGLAGLTALNKTKEIGIRKVLGAGINQIILLLNKGVVKLIAVSLVLAAPVSWYIMEQWLSDFAYRIEIGAGVFVYSAVTALAIALLSVSYHSIKAAMLNPVDSLRSE